MLKISVHLAYSKNVDLNCPERNTDAIIQYIGTDYADIEICMDIYISYLSYNFKCLFFPPQYSACMMCDGFYGPNFGQPVCSTCHLFLFSSDINKEEGEQEVYFEVMFLVTIFAMNLMFGIDYCSPLSNRIYMYNRIQ